MEAEVTPIQKTKCQPCRVKGMKRIEAYVSPERKKEIIRHCKERGFSMAGLLDKLLRKEHL
ncbi:hypothetical protein GO755_04530 [Spirosoma sp. HMF4905]|uniref:Uncharacterized protein n=1 Tax=Spirosoma arboris TaxID=2682092 RepID=A0A7K1S6T2_9BACT|nr:hypothetical protein [Spirosoma arboris]MVM29288.1 hypothetical protein [Spirosoma arboris]